MRTAYKLNSNQGASGGCEIALFGTEFWRKVCNASLTVETYSQTFNSPFFLGQANIQLLHGKMHCISFQQNTLMVHANGHTSAVEKYRDMADAIKVHTCTLKLMANAIKVDWAPPWCCILHKVRTRAQTVTDGWQPSRPTEVSHVPENWDL